MHINDLFTGSGGSLPTKNETPGAGGTEGLNQRITGDNFKALQRIGQRIVAALVLALPAISGAGMGAGIAALAFSCSELVRRAFA